MKPTLKPRVKICCISSRAEAALAIDYGAAALGLVATMPSGPGCISDADIKTIAATIPPPIATFLLTCRTDAAAIIEHQKMVGTNTIQLVDELTNGSHSMIRRELPGIRIVQVIHVMDDSAIDESLRVSPEVDAILLDSGNPKLAIKELGGTGRVHNWQISRQIRERISIPVFLAGGLNPENVGEAVEIVRPFGVDICNGVRTEGRLDPEKLARFFKALGY
ncbi:MAG TPA: phosphoribosylanthranilate isomerase [Bacillota bacterium]|nr:phosphoribosylanthranilate isomerase [Bacillota bacterium]